MLRFLTSGESHGKGNTVIIDGMPANVPISEEKIREVMQKRSKDFGRGGRAAIENDKVEILSGIRFGKTIGSPIALYIENKDYKNWQKKSEKETEITTPRPGHADLAGQIKYGFDDIRPVLERSSARETASRVACGAIFEQFLSHFNIETASHTIQIGKIKLPKKNYIFDEVRKSYLNDPDTRCIDKITGNEMRKEIEKARASKDTLGGIVEVWAVNVPPGLGSYVQYDKKIDAQIAAVIMSIPSVKTVEIGQCVKNIDLYGSQFHDEIIYDDKQGFHRSTNRAGGIEGGITNGMPIIIRVCHKPISTLYNPLRTVDIQTKKYARAAIERSDICVVPRAGIISESMLAFIIMKNFLVKFGEDNLDDIKTNYQAYLKRISWKILHY